MFQIISLIMIWIDNSGYHFTVNASIQVHLHYLLCMFKLELCNLLDLPLYFSSWESTLTLLYLRRTSDTAILDLL